jgi:hypothetical protein
VTRKNRCHLRCPTNKKNGALLYSRQGRKIPPTHTTSFRTRWKAAHLHRLTPHPQTTPTPPPPPPDPPPPGRAGAPRPPLIHPPPCARPPPARRARLGPLELVQPPQQFLVREHGHHLPALCVPSAVEGLRSGNRSRLRFSILALVRLLHPSHSTGQST